MDRPELSIVIPTHSRRQLLGKLLEHLLRQPGPTRELIVVDDGSCDGTRAMLREGFPEVRSLRNDEPKGFDALPEAVRLARGRLIFELDDDAFPADGTMERAVEHFELRGPRLGAVALPFVDAASGRRGYAPYFPPPRDGCGYGPARGFAAGAVVFRREAVEEVPPSPPGYFMYQTEVPTTIELLRRGWEVEFLEDAPVLHHWEARSRRIPARTAFLAMRNDLVTIRRYFGGWRRGEMLAGRCLTGLVHLAAAGKPRLALQAWREAAAMAPGPREAVPDDVLERVYPSFDGLTLMTLLGETNRRRIAWFLGLLPVDQTV